MWVVWTGVCDVGRSSGGLSDQRHLLTDCASVLTSGSVGHAVSVRPWAAKFPPAMADFRGSLQPRMMLRL